MTPEETTRAREALKERATWAAARGFFWLSERDMRLYESLGLRPVLTPKDADHLVAVLMRIGQDTFAKEIFYRANL